MIVQVPGQHHLDLALHQRLDDLQVGEQRAAFKQLGLDLSAGRRLDLGRGNRGTRRCADARARYRARRAILRARPREHDAIRQSRRRSRPRRGPRRDVRSAQALNVSSQMDGRQVRLGAGDMPVRGGAVNANPGKMQTSQDVFRRRTVQASRGRPPSLGISGKRSQPSPSPPERGCNPINSAKFPAFPAKAGAHPSAGPHLP